MSNLTDSALSLLNLTMAVTNTTVGTLGSESSQKTDYDANDILQIFFGICIVGIIMGGGLCMTYLRSSHLDRGMFPTDSSNSRNYAMLSGGPEASNLQQV